MQSLYANHVRSEVVVGHPHEEREPSLDLEGTPDTVLVEHVPCSSPDPARLAQQDGYLNSTPLRNTSLPETRYTSDLDSKTHTYSI